MDALTCFKAYDVRGRLGHDLDEGVAYRIGRAFAAHLGAARVAVGGDARLSTESLKASLAQGLMDSGADVIDLGQTGTEEVYFAAFHLDVDGGIEVTASHNPMDYNGMKFVGRGARPISGDSGLADIRRLAESQDYPAAPRQGALTRQSILKPYVDHLLGYVRLDELAPMRLVADSGNGVAGHVVDELERRFQAAGVPIEFIKLNHEPDGTFPRGVPNPLLPENRQATAEAVRASGVDLGLAWDGDFDRCFLFDERGEFIEGYYIVGLLAEAILRDHPGEKIIHDPRLIWNTIEVVERSGGIPVMSKTGHAFIKERMRAENAIYGGEMSAHHYFRDFAYCDSGMIPWLLALGILSKKKVALSKLVSGYTEKYPCSGEINVEVAEAERAIEAVVKYFENKHPRLDHTDGVSMDFGDWRFNVRKSNTEPIVRINVEQHKSKTELKSRVEEILSIIRSR